MRVGVIWCSSLFCFYCAKFIGVCLLVFCFYIFVFFLLFTCCGVLCVTALFTLPLILFASWCVRRDAAMCYCTVAGRGCECVLSLLLLFHCDEGTLFCAEGCTQVTGVMVAMMMTGRVLLVCALCVLWCGAGSLAEEGPGGTPPDASSSGVGERLQESSLLLQEGLQKSVSEGPEVKDTTGGPDKEILLKEEEDEDEEITPSEEIPPSSQTPPGGGGVPQAADGKLKKVNEGGPKPENQHPVEGGTQNKSEKETVDAGEAELTKQNEGIGVQP
ncbi:mucin-associated surface protein (MASP), putative, partial [Trypanosoma cruzi]